ncbi:hypothetical protein GDO86_019620 [Hymenochirus boettgeri]|uniref:NR LBD domain-containing protein n=1 Tax=Hymenochirus boettgeri TaxID=247094 RepID=A0A8T2IKB7_9PIPI|nr:hypothetical protein GDO86_019620 [Hymenochirus boettgeri]
MQIHILPNNNYTKPILSSCSIGSASPHMGLCQSNYPDLSSDLQQMKDSSTLSDVYNVLPHFADLSTYMIQQVIQFSKEIPAFRALTIEDQISLLKGSTMEVSNIQFNRDFNVETKMWQCGKIRFSIDDGAIAGFQQLYLEPLQKFHLSLRQLNLDQAEYVLLEALILFSPDRPGIMERKVIDEIQEKLAITLKCYIDDHHPLPEGRFLYPKLLSLLAELRTLNEENTRQILHIQDVSSDAMTPLMKEILC